MFKKVLLLGVMLVSGSFASDSGSGSSLPPSPTGSVSSNPDTESITIALPTLNPDGKPDTIDFPEPNPDEEKLFDDFESGRGGEILRNAASCNRLPTEGEWEELFPYTANLPSKGIPPEIQQYYLTNMPSYYTLPGLSKEQINVFLAFKELLSSRVTSSTM